jgi:hypothetical protein
MDDMFLISDENIQDKLLIFKGDETMVIKFLLLKNKYNNLSKLYSQNDEIFTATHIFHTFLTILFWWL